MESLNKIMLVIHIVAGFLALVVAPVAMAVKKGGPLHRFWGKVFFWSITNVAVTSLVMSVVKSNWFLAMVGVFSFYLVAAGYRALYRKNVNSFNDVKFIDWLLILVTGLFTVAMMVLGLLLLVKFPAHAFGYISLVFGLLGSFLVIRDIRSFNMPGHHRENWMYHHMTGMIGGYISTVSAFSVVNMEFLPDLIRWLWPTFLGVPLLIFWIRKYKSRPAV